MRIKEIEKQKCDKCPLINCCGDAFEQPCLCCEERLAEIDVEVYKECYLEECHSNIKKKALELGLEISAPDDLSEEEQEVWEEEHNCFNNTKLAIMELFLERPVTCSYKEWNES